MSDLKELCEEVYFKRNTRIRCEKTRKQYRFALADFKSAVGHTPTLDDLTDDNVAAMMALEAERELAAKTINERRGRINALWSWLAKRGTVKTFPTTPPIQEPVRIPVAWSQAEMAQLCRACANVQGMIAGIKASDWWGTLHLVAWDTGERIGALLAVEWSHLSGEWLTIPAELRKGRKRDMQYKLHAATVAALQRIRQPSRRRIWPWPKDSTYLWTRYKNIRKKAGLPTDRRSSFHRVRKSVATHFEAAGGNATELLGHTSRKVTMAYLDPRFLKKQHPVDLLFRPDQT